MVVWCCRLVVLACCLSACGGCGGEAPVAQNQETWDAVYIQRIKAGYIQTKTVPDKLNGQPCLRIDQEMQLRVMRFRDQTRIGQRLVTWETSEGVLLKFEAEERTGPMVTRTEGVVHGNELEIAGVLGGRQHITRLPWSSEIGGFQEVERSLMRQPMKPGEQRTVRMLMPTLNVVGTVELTARDYESTSLLTEMADLLRIDQQIVIPGSEPLTGACWIDARGAVLKSRMDGLDQEVYRVSRELALVKDGDPLPDLGAGAFVRLSAPIPTADRTAEARYRVDREGGDPSRLFVSGGAQRVRPITRHRSEIDVRAVRLDDPASLASLPVEPPPGDGDRQPSRVLQSDDPNVMKLAAEAVGDEQDPLRMVVMLEKFVHDRVTSKNFTQAFATAADVARSFEGDCTEHAVLLAAMARARGIPARVAMGLKYVDSPEPAFGYHMWTEVYLQGRWAPLDATTGAGGIPATYLKMSQSSLSTDNAYAGFVNIAQGLGRLKIEVLGSQ